MRLQAKVTLLVPCVGRSQLHITTAKVFCQRYYALRSMASNDRLVGTCSLSVLNLVSGPRRANLR